jgi:hypothetical protein
MSIGEIGPNDIELSSQRVRPWRERCTALRSSVSGTDLADRRGRGSGQSAESALDTVSAAHNRGQWCGVRCRKTCLGSSVM